jgi:hypothetical protein
MKTIHKYPLEVKGQQTVEMPYGAQILHVGVQRNQICIWAILESVKPMMVTRSFVIHGTGHPVDDTGLEHIGTVLMDDGALVWHIFERINL